jgi:hypothetical protein
MLLDALRFGWTLNLRELRLTTPYSHVEEDRLLRALQVDRPRSLRFASARVPLPSRAGGLAKLPMFMVWHQRYHKDPAHLWLREQLE